MGGISQKESALGSRSVDFSPDDALLVTASSSDNSGRIWNLQSMAPWRDEQLLVVFGAFCRGV